MKAKNFLVNFYMLLSVSNSKQIFHIFNNFIYILLTFTRIDISDHL